MGVYIKGLEMPKVCAVCPFWETRYDPGYYQYEKCKALGRIFNECRRDISPFEEKLDDCPIVEIPTPHGRLIDEDALIDDLIEQKIPFNARVNESIITTPTILEAEEK